MTETIEFDLTPLEQKTLLADARETITARLEGRRPEYFRDPDLLGSLFGGKTALLVPCGAFVTLHIGKELRGCIGRMNASEPLQKTIRLMAIEAAFGDPRFPPLTKPELSRIHIEISVLSPLEECSDPRSVKVGVHGLYLNCGGRSGVLLPQVPVEQGWNLDEYLDYICVKAGLPEGSYQAPGAKLYTFTAIVFGEERRPD
ncbi:MAG: AmmeMemoRadiSam system protein A [Treponema sp.]|jgi:AmmeMemoRadiSam system protein A|nr:AmmeMemoRadiSam system protein A [Treponema sp.]